MAPAVVKNIAGIHAGFMRRVANLKDYPWPMVRQG